MPDAVLPPIDGPVPAPLEPIQLDGLLDVPDASVAAAEAGRGLRIWALATDAVDAGDLDQARRWFDDAERAQASSFVRAELRHSYEIAHGMARRIVGAVLDRDPGDVVWDRHDCPRCGEPHGRPRVEDAADAGVEFSLAHTPGMVLLAVAHGPVGVDVEHYPAAGGLSGLTGVLHPDEAAEVEKAEDPDEAVARFTRAWTRTEAYLKGVGIGLGRDPHLDYLGTDSAPVRLLEGWRIQDVRVPRGYGAAVATRDLS
ncbi:4'-phosphopantetheinyl transferase superfamily protein [Nocardioides sp. GY 10113]|uniref:4'-phosphopantetheinyl transferase family protein n=1 Tax=Nocardioides sp. GY 10113 TaxID=2569761 RepID=UPI0010A79A3E|nr:4'-phosphopantetheinyl transferase superfamily protein [Nocardioides sp. GY 10113]TIC88232.1 4'-phosphopantetheinyl transferase superfamily protein [Nocardioides sp. GY 10113]